MVLRRNGRNVEKKRTPPGELAPGAFLPREFPGSGLPRDSVQPEHKFGSFVPDDRDPDFRLTALIRDIRTLYEEKLREN